MSLMWLPVRCEECWYNVEPLHESSDTELQLSGYGGREIEIMKLRA